VVAAAVAATIAPVPALQTSTKRVAEPARSAGTPPRVRPAQQPAPPPPTTPEQLGASAGGGFGTGTVFESFAILVASLLVAWLASASRLGATVQPPGDAPGKRRRKPG
jgi:hypothetical protein